MTEPQPSGGFEWTQELWGAALRCAPLLPVASHFFTTSNLRLTDDEDEWRAVAARMAVELAEVRLIRQVHGVDVAICRAGGGRPTTRPEADVIVSNDPSVAIGVRVADCAPVLLADRRRPIVGAAHAGWRGTVKGVAATAVKAMVETFGSDPADLVAAIGPCLGPCCGEVGDEVVEAFRQAGHGGTDVTRWFAQGRTGRPYLDLWAANRDQLARAGIPAAQIHVAELCTKSHASLLHSYRAGERAGRMAAIIRVRSSDGFPVASSQQFPDW
ncbi:MAG: peptidoglycan editing factor PgeF [Vicinamibacterales bacterium]